VRITVFPNLFVSLRNFHVRLSVILKLNNEWEASMASWLGALATAIVAAVAGITAAAITHSAKISEFRQAWINALRDDVATYFKELDRIHFYVGKLHHNKDSARIEELEQQKYEARARLMLVYYRIRLRLNMKESLHSNLVEKLKLFWLVETTVSDQAKIDEAMTIAQALLKEEWDVAKELPLSRWFKRTRKACGDWVTKRNLAPS